MSVRSASWCPGDMTVLLHVWAALPSPLLSTAPLVGDSRPPFLPSHLPRHRLFVPGLAILTGRVATVMDDCALCFGVRVLHLCYLSCGSLSKSSCLVKCDLLLLHLLLSSLSPCVLLLRRSFFSSTLGLIWKDLSRVGEKKGADL